MKNRMHNQERDEWKRSFSVRLITYAVHILRYAESLKSDTLLRPIVDQLVRSGTSVGANVSEAQGAQSRKDFAHYFQIALKSAKETQYWLVVIAHYKGKDLEVHDKLLQETKEIVKILTSSLLTTKGERSNIS